MSEPKIVAECWTCAEIPPALRVPGNFPPYAKHPPKKEPLSLRDAGGVAYHRTRGHDVRPVEVKRGG